MFPEKDGLFQVSPSSKNIWGSPAENVFHKPANALRKLFESAKGYPAVRHSHTLIHTFGTQLFSSYENFVVIWQDNTVKMWPNLQNCASNLEMNYSSIQL